MLTLNDDRNSPQHEIMSIIVRSPNCRLRIGGSQQDRLELFLVFRHDGHGGEVSQDAQERVLNLLTEGLIRVERQLGRSGGPWLLGDYSITDITMMVCFHRFEDVRLDAILFETSLRRTADYWLRLQQRPSYREAVLDWHEEENWRSATREVFGEGQSPQLELLRQKIASAA
jgi:hypothetical protein